MRLFSLLFSILFVFSTLSSMTYGFGFGYGAYGLMPNCGMEVAGGSVDKFDTIDDIEKNMREIDKEKRKEESELKKLKEKLRKDRDTISKAIGAEKTDFLTSHIESNAACGDYSGCYKSGGKSYCSSSNSMFQLENGSEDPSFTSIDRMPARIIMYKMK